jgi:diguanylate cyclase (GGDEF)-like protein
MHDYLTGALNRHGLSEIYERTKPGKEQSVIMIDLDHFKMINDTHGHSAGDAVLKTVAQKIDEMTSQPLCRWGGEEFVVWFPEENVPDSLAESIRCTVKELPIEYENGNTLHITISIGIARGSDKDDMHDLIDIADEHLYKAKANGRDCVVS